MHFSKVIFASLFAIGMASPIDQLPWGMASAPQTAVDGQCGGVSDTAQLQRDIESTCLHHAGSG
jgi:hypothetical protein